jgi:superfamily II DNA/RNA helicase
MLDLIEPLLVKRKLAFVRLDGSVPQKRRPELVHEFQNNPECRFFITTNAGSTGLNLQAANTVINVDLPWNPAVLEQRIARAHRMGQTQPVQVFVLVTESTIEENLLATLSSKKEVALAALDPDSDVDVVELASGTEDLKSRLEVLLGARPEAFADKTEEKQTQETALRQQHRDRVAAAGGELLGAALQFLGQLVGGGEERTAAPPAQIVNDLRSRLEQCVEEEPNGRVRLAVTLPSRESLNAMAQTLASFLVAGESPSTTSRP